MARSALVFVTLVCACKTVEGPSGQGGAGFRAPSVERPLVPLSSMLGVCWPASATPNQRLLLTPAGGDWQFEAKQGASNGTGWCLRELVTSYPPVERPTEAFESAPPTGPVDLWAALAWVKLLAPSRFGPERGLLDPAPWAAGCYERSSVRGGTIAVDHAPVLAVRGLTSIESERCLAAVLGATAWPAPKELRLALGPVPKGVTPTAAVRHYFAPEAAGAAVLDAQIVKETMRGLSPKVSACWNEALARRAGLSGSRTFRFRTDGSGVLTAAWVASGLSDGLEAADVLLDGCLARALEGVRFPGTSGDGFYTWVFASR